MQLWLEDRYTLLVPRSTPMSRPAGIGGSVHSACTQIHSNVFCSGSWRIGTLCLYLSVHFNVTSCCSWRSGTFCLYPAPLHGPMQQGLEDRYILSVPTYSLFTATCCCGWRIGTLCLYPDPLHCLMQLRLGDRYILSVPTCSLFITVQCHVLLGLEDRYILLVPRSTPRSYTNLISLFRSRPIAWLCDLLKWGEI